MIIAFRPLLHCNNNRSPLDDWMIPPIHRNRELSLWNDSALHQFSAAPGYKIHHNESTFQIEMDVPGIEAADLTVQLEEDGSILRVKGERKYTNTNDHSNRPKKKASKRIEACFSIDSDVDSNNMKVKLENGVLVVVAPKVKKEEESKIRKLKINLQNTKPNKSTENDKPNEGTENDKPNEGT